MSYIHFDKTLMTNLAESLPKEILRSNRSGAYSCSTIVDCNTRKYHGLLVVPVPELSDENYVLLSSLDETIVQHGAEFNMGLHKYHGNNFSPNGHKYIREYNCDKVPTTIYRVGGVLLKKEKVFQHYENRIIIRYTLLDAHSDTILRLRPFLAFRSVREYTHENAMASRDYQTIPNGIKTCMYPGYPELYMQSNKKNEFVFQPDWYRGVEYPKEQERGYAFNEDLYVPGYFEFKIKKGETIIFSAGLSEIKTSQLERITDFEINIRTPRDNFYHCLVNSAHQFYYHSDDNENYILAGYPWFKCRARDMFISLPGLTLTNDETDQYELCMATAEKAIRNFIEDGDVESKIKEIDQPDVLLWAIWCIQQYSNIVSPQRCREKYGKLLKDMILYIIDNKHPNLKVRENGLVYSKGKDKAITWMNSTANGKPIVPRSGYIVEFNALWYNAIKFCQQICEVVGNVERVEFFKELSAKVEESFRNVFWNQYDYLFDYVDETNDSPDWSVRPNMIFAVAFDYSPLNLKERKKILDICTKELLTPKGLRSLSPKSGGYNPMYVGPQVQRDYAYHQGTVWPWLGGFYMEACLRLYKFSRMSFIERILVGYEEEMFSHCLGTIPELFDGNPPFNARGAISFAMNVAEILRVVKLLDKMNLEAEQGL